MNSLLNAPDRQVPLLSVDSLTVRYGSLTAVSSLSLTVCSGDWLMLIGPNGAGKSSVIRAISRNVPYSGRILLDGTDVRRLTAAELARGVGVLSQSSRVEYAYTVEEIVRLGRYAHERGIFFHRDPRGPEHVDRALEAVGLSGLRHACVPNLSGGEAQRVFLAQVFAQDPRLLILDEPANHLDLKYQRQIFTLIGEWLKQEGRAVISVVHDLSLARRFGTRTLLMREGRCAAVGTPEDVFTPALLQEAYGMDVHAWMRELNSFWTEA